MVDIFSYPTISGLTSYVFGDIKDIEKVTQSEIYQPGLGADEIAIIGYSGTFSGSDSIDAYWDNILSGKNCISFLNKEECLKLGVPEDALNNDGYVAAGGIISDIDKFDAAFWGLSPRDAELLDPQARLLLEHTWKALEMSGHIKSRNKSAVGVFVGGGGNQYAQCNLALNSKLMETADLFDVGLLASKEHLATRVSYLFDFQGPVVNVYTACSTSLVALAEACNQLMMGSLSCCGWWSKCYCATKFWLYL